MEDQQIVALYWQRNPEAIGQSRQKYGAYCFSVANQILASPEDSEECVNDTWLNAWNGMPPHRPDVLRIFLAKITRRIAFNRFKSRTAQKRGGGEITAVLEELEECLAGGADVEEEVVAKELGECIRQFVRGLPAREGDVFSRRYFFTERIQDIAQAYGLTPNNIMVILSRVRKKLKTHLEKEGYLHESGRPV